MRGILINPWDRSITEIDVPCDDYKAIYRALSQPATDDDPGHKVDCFDIRSLGNGRGGETVWLYFDDNGCLGPGVPMFTFRGGTINFPGRGLILGADEAGETAATSDRFDHLRYRRRASQAHRGRGGGDGVPG